MMAIIQLLLLGPHHSHYILLNAPNAYAGFPL
jgi:hypothetical protein